MAARLTAPTRPGLDAVTAVVLTHRRPRLATAAVRYLVEAEGFVPDRVVVVVNGEGGLDAPALEAQVRMVRLTENTGPAGGFRAGLLEAFAAPGTQWAYLCEDDVSLLGLPAPRVAGLLERLPAAAALAPVGAISPFGRRFVPGSGHSANFVPRRGLPGDLARIDVSMWSATLVSRAVVEAGVLPDPGLFFGFEDFDFFCSLREAGFTLLVDALSARRVVTYQTLEGRDEALRRERPVDAEEPWRAYYVSRNFFHLARRHGRRSWLAWHWLFTLRRLQLARSAGERLALARGFLDGARGRLGPDPRYLRAAGERQAPAPEPDPAPGAPAPAAGPDRAAAAALAARTLAMVVSHNAPGALARCLAAMAGQSTPPAAVLVVDNASTPPVEAAALAGCGLPVTVVRSEENTGPAGGWALAFEAFLRSAFDLAWALDDDILPDPDCLEVLLGAAASAPEDAFCFPRAVQPDGSVGAWGAWCGFVVSRAIVEEVGIPRAELFWWAEDNEYVLWRIPKAGHPRRIVEGALVQHDAIRQGAQRPMWKYYYEARNMLYLHLHLMRRVGWYPKNVTKLVARALFRERGRRRLTSLLAIGRGLVDGLRGRLGVTFPIEPMREERHIATPTAAPRRDETPLAAGSPG